ncbi:MAG: NERD domain-containing protein [Chloroflexi bacterium]|nr:NERD domain-containing protein [Chloroflexota bacterium]MBU1751213.1 NERD domain-containing protein [Chloroflexota bacterium]
MRTIVANAELPDAPGEHELARVLGLELDDTYTLLRGLTLPRATDVIDAVLVGPFGVLVMALFEYEGCYACDGDSWFHSPDDGQSWRTSIENPIKQALYDHIQVKAHLDHAGLRDVPLEQAVVFPSANTRVVSRDPAAPLLDLDQLQQHVRQLRDQTYLSATQVAGVVRALGPGVVAQPAPSTTRPAPPVRRAANSLGLWGVALVLLVCGNLAICLGFVLVWLWRNPL